jgi:hypothetical protein
MKKILLSLAIILIIVPSFAQEPSRVEFGVKAGANFANLSDDADTDRDSRTAVHLGLLAHIHLSKFFALQPELLYSAQGAISQNETKTKLGYISIPVLLQYMFDNGFRLQTGPQFSFLAGAENEFNDVDTDIKDLVKSTDISWSFGLGFLTESGFGVDARYNLGLTDISENDAGLKNRVFQIGLFYQFRHR